MRALSQVRPRGGGALRRVDFGNLGAEELGSVYESLLELIPRYDAEQLAYTLETLAGNERKESGSYYTPTSLVECLLDSALDPLLDEACAHGTVEERVSALLDITVCDPACGSGHFLVAAARRIAKRIAAEETGESEPPDAVVRAALRRVVGRCIYGVDVNPMAAELAKVSLWIEALEPGKPLSYLDHNIRVGNSLLGVTPALLADGLPDAAFAPIEGDDRKVASALKKQNAGERARPARPIQPGRHPGHQRRPGQTGRRDRPGAARQPGRPAHPPAAPGPGTRRITELRLQKLLADAWCAAFVQPKTAVTRSTAITQAILERFGADAGTLELAAAEKLVETSPASTASSTGTSSSRISSASATAPGTSTRHRLGRRLLLRLGNPPGSGRAPGTGVLRRPPARDRERAQRRCSKKMIAALADSKSADRIAVRGFLGPSYAGLQAGDTCSVIGPIPTHGR